MAKTTKYGILSDVHRNPAAVRPAVERLKGEGVDAIVLNGDIGDNPEHILSTLLLAAETKLPVYAAPGSHEDVASFTLAYNAVKKRHDNVHNVVERPVLEGKGHSLVFIPGSDWSPGHVSGYKLTDDSDQGYQFRLTSEGRTTVMPISEEDMEVLNKYMPALDNLMYISNPYTLENLVEDPDTTIVVSHVPHKMSNVETSPDMAHFYDVGIYADGEFNPQSIMPGVIPPKAIVQSIGGGVVVGKDMDFKDTIPQLDAISKKHNVRALPVAIEKVENRGNEALAEAFRRASVVKAINGHFHESAHRAVNLAGEKLSQGEATDELYWNASYSDAGRIGILKVKEDQVKYYNIDLGKEQRAQDEAKAALNTNLSDLRKARLAELQSENTQEE